MLVNHSMDKLVKKRQDKCEHPYQDRVLSPKGVFCGLCGKMGQ